MNLITIKKDIYYAKKLIDLSFILSDSRYTKYCRIPFVGTENVKELYAMLDTTFDKSLMVTGSSDQLLEAILYGAKEIITFDINKFAGYGCALKIAAIKALEYEEFIDFYFASNMSLKYYEKLRVYLNAKDLYFWDEIYNYKNGYTIKNCLFDAPYHKSGDVYYQNYSLYEKDLYNKIKDKVSNDVIINFINCNLLDIKKKINLEEKFDFIYLSTIYYYLKKSIKNYIKFIQSDIIPKLNEDGQAILHYFYGIEGVKLHEIIEFETLKNDFNIMYNMKKELGVQGKSIDWSGYGNPTFNKDLALILNKNDFRRK